jgi:hypothetical protein
MQAGALYSQSLNLPTPMLQKTLTKVTDVAYRPTANQGISQAGSQEPQFALLLDQPHVLEVLTPPAELAWTF